jgi:hypothetical protein
MGTPKLNEVYRVREALEQKPTLQSLFTKHRDPHLMVGQFSQAEDVLSPYKLQQRRQQGRPVKYDELDPQLFAHGQVRVQDGSKASGYGSTYRVERDGTIVAAEDNQDSSG